MLKRIAADQLAIGMHLDKLCGSWLEHPFWRTNFLVADPQDLRAIAASGIREVWIDTSKGLDVARPAAAPAQAAIPALAPGPGREPAPRPPEPAAVPVELEAGRARALCQRASTAMKSLYSEVRLGNAIDLEGCLPLVDEISESLARNSQALIGLSRLKLRDEYTYMHSVTVCALMVALARQMGLPPEQVREAGVAGLLHDMGKARVPLELLNKPERLTEPEFRVIRKHPELGHELLVDSGIDAPGVLDVCLHHHERVDGKGYPHQLGDDRIALLTKMGAVCDVYDAITSNRPYKDGWEPGESLRRMAKWQGHFDPLVFQSFVKAVGIYPTGSLVRLESGRLAVVVEQNVSRLTTPRVKAFYSTKSGMRILPEFIELGAPGCRDRIVASEPAENWPFTDLQELWSGSAAA
jgi:putative nucleotidyltransferase with HDIG domain